MQLLIAEGIGLDSEAPLPHTLYAVLNYQRRILHIPRVATSCVLA